MELAASASASAVCSAYRQLSAPAAAADRGGGGDAQETATRLDRRRRKRGGGCAGLRRRCYAVLKQQRTRLYILRRCVTMLLCWHQHDLSD
jgi:hypothetical protein